MHSPGQQIHFRREEAGGELTGRRGTAVSYVKLHNVYKMYFKLLFFMFFYEYTPRTRFERILTSS